MTERKLLLPNKRFSHTLMNEKYDNHQILVIGYGNTLRGDDGVGYQIAETVADWQIPQVRSIAIHQLLPELAAAMADVDIVMFIDAITVLDSITPNINVTLLVPDPNAAFSTHVISPQLLLSLTQRLYSRTPDAYLLTIPAINFTLGTTLSSIASTGQKLALDYLKCWLNDPTMKLCMK
jgi:hydrogenase maturation protease